MKRVRVTHISAGDRRNQVFDIIMVNSGFAIVVIDASGNPITLDIVGSFDEIAEVVADWEGGEQ